MVLPLPREALFYEGMFKWIREEWEMARSRTRTIVIVAAIVFFLGFIGMIYILRNWQSDPVSRGDHSAAGIEEEVEVIGEQAILNAYFQAMGGVDKLAELRSVRATGEAAFPDGSITRVVVVKKAGGFIRFMLGTAPSQIIIGVNPSDAWQSSWVDNQEVIVDLDPIQLDNMRRSGYPSSKLFMAMQNDWTITYLGQKAFNYKMAHVFEVRIDEREIARFFIDPDTFEEVGTEEWLKSGSEFIITRHIQSEHFEADGLMFPGKIQTSINGVPSHDFTVRKVEVNPGVLNSSFYRPES